MSSSPNNDAASPMSGLRIGVDSFSLDPTTSHRKLRSIEIDGSLTYDENKTPEAKLTETLSRIWNEYPGGMLDITEASLESGDLDNAAIEAVDQPEEDSKKEDGGMMTFEEMGVLRGTVLERLNAARNELWYLFELAKTLQHSTPFTSNPPAPPSAVPLPTPKKQKGKSKPEETKTNATALIQQTDEPPVIPPGTFSTTPSLPPQKSTMEEVLELETALAAKQAALEECSRMIDGAVEELTIMADAGDRFWEDVRRLKDGRRGRGQWAVVPKPDFGRIMGEGDKAKDIIIPYAIDEASAATRARCLAAFDLDPAKKELAYGARNYLRLQVTLTDPNGMSTTSSRPAFVPDSADVGEKMEEAQIEAFDEDLFAEIRAEVLRRGTGVVEAISINFDIGDQNLLFELVDTREPARARGAASPLCDFILVSSRLSLLQLLRARKQRLLTGQPEPARPPSVLAPLVHILQYYRLAGQITESLRLLSKTIGAVGFESRIITRLSLDEPEVVMRILEEPGSIDALGCIFTLELDGSRGVLTNTAAPSSITVTTSRATFPISDAGELTPILSEDVSLQLLNLLIPIIKNALDDKKRSEGVFVDGLEEAIQIPDIGALRLSILPPYDSVQVKFEREDGLATFDSRSNGDLREWIRGALVRPQNEDVEM